MMNRAARIGLFLVYSFAMETPVTQRFAFNTFGNPQVAALPPHLCRYVVDQEYEHYTPADQALWRYVMRQNHHYLKHRAYYPYIPGLRKAGLTIERIPDLQEMNDALGEIGWGAVAVDGFIPPAAFMEYQARRVLVIAADIRTLEHIEYTPAPDIIHESAGHAPIISETRYHQFLSRLGYIGTKALFSAKDFELYEAIRQLSILKETPHVDEQELTEAEERLAFLQQNMGEPSEMALLSRLQWWTVEYGLIGSLEDPKIYGAGLLSSIGESASCMRPEVAKLPLTIDTIRYGYDITKPQPQLFVTPDFENLLHVLDQFEAQMAWRKGGPESVQKAIDCRNICTLQLDSGIQISGVFSEMKCLPNGEIAFIRTKGTTIFCYDDRFLEDQVFEKGIVLLPGLMVDHTVTTQNGDPLLLELPSGIRIQGRFDKEILEDGELISLRFTNVLVSFSDSTYVLDERYERFTLAIGTKVVSVFNGSADKTIFEEDLYVSDRKTRRPSYTTEDLRYQLLFQQVRDIREQKGSQTKLKEIWQQLKQEFPRDWLCTLEILEIADDEQLKRETRQHLLELQQEPELGKLISDGMELLEVRD